MNFPALEVLRDLLHYNPETGIVTNKTFRSSQALKGAEAGCLSKSTGYRLIEINGISRVAHRVAWALHYGDWPKGEIDHISGDQSDNRIANLRICLKTQNAWNRKVSNRSMLGLKGVSRNRNRWVARIMVNKKAVCIGTFDTPEEASQAYAKAASQHHGEFSREDPNKINQPKTAAIAKLEANRFDLSTLTPDERATLAKP